MAEVAMRDVEAALKAPGEPTRTRSVT